MVLSQREDSCQKICDCTPGFPSSPSSLYSVYSSQTEDIQNWILFNSNIFFRIKKAFFLVWLICSKFKKILFLALLFHIKKITNFDVNIFFKFYFYCTMFVGICSGSFVNFFFLDRWYLDWSILLTSVDPTEHIPSFFITNRINCRPGSTADVLFLLKGRQAAWLGIIASHLISFSTLKLKTNIFKYCSKIYAGPWPSQRNGIYSQDNFHWLEYF